MKVPCPNGGCCAKRKTVIIIIIIIIISKDTDHSKNWNGVNKIQGRQVAKIERCVKVRIKMSLCTP